MMSVLNYFADGTIPKRMGSASPQNAPYQAFETKDGAFTVGTGNEVLWKKFCEFFNLSYLINDPEYSTNALRVKNQKSLSLKIQNAVKNLSTQDCINRLENAGIPCGPINTLDKVLIDSQVIARNLIVEMNHKKAGKVYTIAFPVKLSKTPANIRLAPALLGEHTAEILNKLGYKDEEIAQLENEGVIETYRGN
jgi:crotonobetainyl-CoA:carnitine CoA-transferase CaiB-like acyl-CoA transferase